MIDSMLSGPQGPQRDTYVPAKSQTIRAYLLECQLRQLLAEKVPPSDYYKLHWETGISILDLEVAIEDRLFLLDNEQLQHCLSLFEEQGLLSLIGFLHTPHLVELPQQENKEEVPLSQLLEHCPLLEEMGYPTEVIEDWCQDQTQCHEYR